MSTTKAQQKAVNKYMKENYDRINLTLPKGRKAEIKAYAEAYGESVNSFIGRAIKETMERDKSINELKTAAPPTVQDVHHEILVAEPEQVAALLPEPKMEEHCKQLTEDAENNVDLVKLLADVNYQLDIAEDYGMENLSMLLDKARQQEVLIET